MPAARLLAPAERRRLHHDDVAEPCSRRKVAHRPLEIGVPRPDDDGVGGGRSSPGLDITFRRASIDRTVVESRTAISGVFDVRAHRRIWQSRQRREFVDSLIPLEVEAELAGGVLPPELDGRTTPRRSPGAVRHEHPKSAGGAGLTALQQVLVRGAGGAGHRRAGLVMGVPSPSWFVDVATEFQRRERWPTDGPR